MGDKGKNLKHHAMNTCVGELRTLPGSETRTIQPTAWSLYRLRYYCSYPQCSRRDLKLTTHLQLRERVRICGALPPLPRTPSRRAQNINICRNMNSGQCHGLQRNTGWTRNTCHYMQQSSELIKISLRSTVGRKSLITPLPHPSDVRSIRCLSSRNLHDSSLDSCEQTVLGRRNHMQPAT